MTNVNRTTIVEYFGRLDELVAAGTELYIYGGAAVAALGADIRTTMDIDVAEPYSRFDHNAFPAASAKAGLPVNPPDDYDAAFLEMVGAFRLCVPTPTDERSGQIVFKGVNLTIRTGSVADLVASKLIRYDEQDQQDIQFLLGNGRATMDEIREAVDRLPPTFRDDPLVRENLDNLATDRTIWGIA